jgi:hypothetical protein
VNEFTIGVWTVCGNSDAGDVRVGVEKQLVHSGIRCRMRTGVGLRIPSRSMAFWTSRSSVDWGRSPALVVEAGVRTTRAIRIR